MASKSSRRRKRAARRPAPGTTTPGDRPTAGGTSPTPGGQPTAGDDTPTGLIGRGVGVLAHFTRPIDPDITGGPVPAGSPEAEGERPPTGDDRKVGPAGTASGETTGEVSPGDDVPAPPVKRESVQAAFGRAPWHWGGPGARWGLGDAIGGWAVAQLASIVAIAAVVTYLGYPRRADIGGAVGQAVAQTALGDIGNILTVWGQLPLEWQLALQLPLWVGLLGAPIYAARRKGQSLRRDFGLRFERTDIPVGLAIGIACQLVLVPLIYAPLRALSGGNTDVSEPARGLVEQAVTPLGVVLLLLVVVVGAPFVEELFYRGLVQRSLLNRLARPGWAVVVAALFFAIGHMQSLQFPALVAVGVVFGLLAYRSRRLGLSMFAHAGFNITTAVVFLFDLNLPFR